MISFIIVGRNEGWKLSKCLQSVHDTIAYNQIEKHEVIYVDSQSSDDSVIRAKAFEDVKVILLTKDYNSAIARNVGAKEANGDIFYFVDGDMELEPDFLEKVIKDGTLHHPFVSGQYVNYFYNQEGEFLSKEIYDKSIQTQDRFKVVTGGLFIIERKHWDMVNGMRNKYKRSQDIDLGLRLAQNGIKLLRKKDVMAKHHTISYRDEKRLWEMFFNRSELYGKSLLYRDHIFNKHIYPIVLRSDYTMLALCFSLLFYFFIYKGGLLFLLIYLLPLSIRSVFAARKKIIRIPVFFLYFLLRDFFVMVSFFLFFPKKDFDISHKRV